MPDLAPRTLLHGRYLMLRPLGKGGMGAVYEAVDTRLHNTVAVKQITIEGSRPTARSSARPGCWPGFATPPFRSSSTISPTAIASSS